MPTFLAGAAAYTVLFTLVSAVLGHLRRPSGLAAALAAHGVLRRPSVTAAAVVTTEAALAALLLLGVLLAAPGPLAVGLGGAAALFTGYGCYASHVVAAGRGGPCGCGAGPEVAMSRWVAGRAFALAALAAGALGRSGAVAALSAASTLATTGQSLLLVVLAGATFGTLLWHLPAAMHDPAARRRPLQARP